MTTLDLEKLTPEARDGVAAARPWWQTEPCPTWCEETHRDGDMPEDRFHCGGYRSVPLNVMPPQNFGPPDAADWHPTELHADLMRGDREAEPRLVVGTTADAAAIYMTLAEAERVALHLLALVEIGREGTR